MIDLSHAIAETRLNHRICPIPEVWQKIYDMLPAKSIMGWPGSDIKEFHPDDYEVPRTQRQPIGMPVFKSDSCISWDFQSMRLDFREHLAWASTHGLIEEVYQIIHDLPEDQWLHMGDKVILPPVLHKPPILI